MKPKQLSNAEARKAQRKHDAESKRQSDKLNSFLGAWIEENYGGRCRGGKSKEDKYCTVCRAWAVKDLVTSLL